MGRSVWCVASSLRCTNDALIPSVGEIIYVRFFQRPVIILNSARAAQDLMEKRGAKYSGRPPFTYTTEL